MFTLDLEPTFSWKCTLRLPGQQPQHFTALFRLLSESLREALPMDGDVSVLKAAVIKLEGVTLPDGTPIDTPELIARVVDLLPWRAALSAGYSEAVYGIPSAASLGN